MYFVFLVYHKGIGAESIDKFYKMCYYTGLTLEIIMKAKKRNIKVARKTKKNKSFLQTVFAKTNYVLRAAFAENGK